MPLWSRSWRTWLVCGPHDTRDTSCIAVVAALQQQSELKVRDNRLACLRHTDHWPIVRGKLLAPGSKKWRPAFWKKWAALCFSFFFIFEKRPFPYLWFNSATPCATFFFRMLFVRFVSPAVDLMFRSLKFLCRVGVDQCSYWRIVVCGSMWSQKVWDCWGVLERISRSGKAEGHGSRPNRLRATQVKIEKG